MKGLIPQCNVFPLYCFLYINVLTSALSRDPAFYQRLDNETSYNLVATPELFSGAATLSLFIVGIIAFMVRSNSEFMFMQTQVGIFRLISCFFVLKFS